MWKNFKYRRIRLYFGRPSFFWDYHSALFLSKFYCNKDRKGVFRG